MKEEQTIDPIQKTAMFADLQGLTCELNHGGWEAEDDSAADYLILPVGPTVVLDNGVKVQELDKHYAVPICGECAYTLYRGDPLWVLVYCLKCGTNHWILRAAAKNVYSPDNVVVWFTACEECIEDGETVGLYFQDNE